MTAVPPGFRGRLERRTRQLRTAYLSGRLDGRVIVHVLDDAGDGDGPLGRAQVAVGRDTSIIEISPSVTDRQVIAAELDLAVDDVDDLLAGSFLDAVLVHELAHVAAGPDAGDGHGGRFSATCHRLSIVAGWPTPSAAGDLAAWPHGERNWLEAVRRQHASTSTTQ